MASDINGFIESYGFGKFGFLLLSFISLTWFLDGIEICLSSIIGPVLRCEFGLTSFQTALISSAVFFGMGFGSICVGWLCDKLGRRLMVLLTLSIVTYFGFLCTTVDDAVWFFIIRVFVGIGLTGMIIAPCYVTEYFGTKYRAKASFVLECFFGLGVAYATLMAYFFLNTYGWRIYLLVLLVPNPLALLFAIWLPESIRYLQSAGNYDQLFKTLHYISNLNKVAIPKDIELKSRNTKNNASFQYVYKHHFITTLASVGIFITQLLIYFGEIFINSEIYITNPCTTNNNESYTGCKTQSDAQYLQIFLSSFGDIAGILAAMFISDYIGRKPLMYISSTINILGLVLMNFCLPNYLLAIILFVCRALSGLGTVVMWVLVGETFTTNIRGTVFGICNTAGRLSLVFAPFLVQWLMYFSFVGMTCVFILLCMLSSLFVFLMPKETFGKPLTEELK